MLAGAGFWKPSGPTFPNGCHVAEVEIDPETGAWPLVAYTMLHDFGRVLNPLLLEGQLQGGVAQGIGQAACERVVHDPRIRADADRLAGWTTPCRAPTTCRRSTLETLRDAGAEPSARHQGMRRGGMRPARRPR